MSRLPQELQRLFRPPGADPLASQVAVGDTVDAQGRVRALVLQVSGPAPWHALAAVWRGVQADLDLSAPAIAVNGRDAMQLWMPLAEPVDSAQAAAFLQGLCRRWLAAVPPARLGLHPNGEPGPAGTTWQAGAVPQPQGASGQWSAFIAPDLAPIFEDTPWLDGPPGDDAQAGLLSRVRPIAPADWNAAVAQLLPEPAEAAPLPGPEPGRTAPAPGPTAPRRHAAAAVAAADAASGHPEAQRFLLHVLRDASVPLALRVEAAKALLTYGPDRCTSTDGPPQGGVTAPQ